MIHDQVAIGSPTRATPKCAANAITYRTSAISHTAMVGALPELRIRSPFARVLRSSRNMKHNPRRGASSTVAQAGAHAGQLTNPLRDSRLQQGVVRDRTVR